MTARFLIALGLLASGCGSATEAVPSITGPVEARRAHDFEVHPTLAFVCRQHVRGAPGFGEIDWDLYASPAPMDELVAWYRARVAVTPAEESGSWVWRVPTGDAPDHVLRLYAAARTDQPSCDADPPAGTRTLANFSTLTR